MREYSSNETWYAFQATFDEVPRAVGVYSLAPLERLRTPGRYTDFYRSIEPEV
jgi:hypothetical protein